VDSGPEDVVSAAYLQPEAGGHGFVDAQVVMGLQAGDGNTQDNTRIIYTYNNLTWADGVALPPLVSVSGVLDSPYRGLAAFEERDAGFFFGRDEVVAQLLARMSHLAGGPGMLVVSGASGAGNE
jgi:hypothetical protein